MPIVNPNGYNAAFNAFVHFAQERAHIDGGKAVVGAKINAPLEERRILSLGLVRNDSVHNLLRDVSQFEVNNTTRHIFRKAIADMFGGESNIPASVKKAMLMRDYDCGKPLTARRILAVKAAIDADGTARVLAERKAAEMEAATGNIKAALAEAQCTPEERDNAVEAIMRIASADRDLLAVLQANGCNPVKGIAVDGRSNLRAEDKIVERLEAIRQNIAELRAAAKGSKAMFEAGIKQLANFNGKALRNGTIARMCDLARKVSLGALQKITAESSPSKIFAAICHLHKSGVDIYRKSGIMNQFEELGADEINAINSFAMSLIYSRCGGKALGGLRQGLHSDNSAKVRLAIENIGYHYKGADKHVKTLALTLGGLFWRNAVGVLNDTIGDGANPVEPNLKAHYNITPDEFNKITRLLEDLAPQVRQGAGA